MTPEQEELIRSILDKQTPAKPTYTKVPCLRVSFEYETGIRDFVLRPDQGDYWTPDKKGKYIVLKHGEEQITLLTARLLWYSVKPSFVKVAVESPITKDSLSSLEPRVQEPSSDTIEDDIPLRVRRKS